MALGKSPGSGLESALAKSETARQQWQYWSRDLSGRRPPSHPVVRALFEPRAEDIASLVPHAVSASILDVGCGNGFLTHYLAGRFGRVVALDYSPVMLRANPCRKRICASALRLPFSSRSFDIVVASHLLHHLESEDRKTAVREMARVARSALVLFEPNRNNPLMFLFGLSKPEERMTLSFSSRYLRSLVAESGFSAAEVRVEGLTVPNRAPVAYAPLGRALNKTPLRHLGFYVRAIATRSSGAVER